jgi:hypothetical protein
MDIKESINRVLTSVEGFELGLIAARHAVKEGKITIGEFEEMMYEILFQDTPTLEEVEEHEGERLSFDDDTIDYYAQRQIQFRVLKGNIVYIEIDVFRELNRHAHSPTANSFLEARMVFVRWYIDYKGVFTN